ncbi:MAG: transketolase [Deltaproteobacteria bacterium]|jgi:transketolase|nr:transketolase [Deltaproteobacteria bacterium]
MNELTQKYSAIKKECQRTILNLHKRANAGHIATSLSCLDICIWLFFEKMRAEDKCILSKGHGASAFYTVLAKSGRLAESMLELFYSNGTVLAAHPPCNSQLAAIPFGTGSLGHGLSLAAGLAFSQRYTNKAFHVYCILSDGDLNEGSTWEAMLFAAQHQLTNLTIVVDYNRLQACGRTEDIISLEPLTDKFRSFRFEVAISEAGNNLDSLEKAHHDLVQLDSKKPRCIIAYTTKGSGISFMENKFEWHYLALNDEEFKQALLEIG